MPLKTETNTPEMGSRIQEAACSVLHPLHDILESDFEHGQWWISCRDCGTQWSVVDAEGGSSVDGFDFEQVTEGDGFCEEEGAR